MNFLQNNVKIERKSEEELWEIINKNNSGLLNEMCNVFSTIISLIKSNNYSIDYVKNINEVQSSLINKLTLELITPLYLDYQKDLKKQETQEQKQIQKQKTSTKKIKNKKDNV